MAAACRRGSADHGRANSLDAATFLLAASRPSPAFAPLFLLGLILLFAFLVASALLILAPLVVLVTHRQSPVPEVLPHEPGAVQTPADDFFNNLGPRLADLGFGETQRWSFNGFARASPLPTPGRSSAGSSNHCSRESTG